jgi:methyltransferase (TIGR00027 family)
MSAIPENIIHSGTPSRSALRVAMVRASHELLDEPIIFADPFALPILGAQASAAIIADPFQFNDPMSRGMRASLVARSKYAEDELRKSVQAGVRQYVVLGAGLDTFALRNPYADLGLKVFEVDHPSTQEWKKTLLQNAGIAVPKETTFAAVDFEKKTLFEGLREAGFRTDQPAFFSWLGVTLYLTRDAIFETLRFVSTLPKGSAIAFDYGMQRSLLNPIERAVMDYIGQVIAQQGEPWISFFDPAELGVELRKMGFEHIDDVGPDDLNPRYFARRKDGLRTGGGSRLMCARS